MEVLESFEIHPSVDDVLRGEGVDPAVVRIKKPTLLRAAEEALEEGLSMVHPVALVHQVEVLEHRHERILVADGNEFVSPLVARHLAGAESITVAVCTIGPQLEDFVSITIGKDPLLGIALDGLANASVDFLSQQVCRRLAEAALVSGLTTSTPLSPGEPEWSVEIGQPQLFNLLDPSRVGITLTSGGMMVPKKSISFVVGTGSKMVQTDLCELCSLWERCRYRHE